MFCIECLLLSSGVANSAAASSEQKQIKADSAAEPSDAMRFKLEYIRRTGHKRDMVEGDRANTLGHVGERVPPLEPMAAKTEDDAASNGVSSEKKRKRKQLADSDEDGLNDFAVQNVYEHAGSSLLRWQAVLEDALAQPACIDEEALAAALAALDAVPMTIEMLSETGLGKAVNKLRKSQSSVAAVARNLYEKWKALASS